MIRKCLAMQMPSLGTKDKKVASLNQVSLKRPVGNVEVVSPMQQSVLRKTSHVIIVRRRIMLRSFVRNLKRTIIRTRAILTRKKQRLFKLLGAGSVFIVYRRCEHPEQAVFPVNKSKGRMIKHMKYDRALNSYVVKENVTKNLLKIDMQYSVGFITF